MADESPVLDLLQRWEDLREAGREVSPEELCADRPDLLDEVRAGVESLKRMARQLDCGDTGQPGQTSAETREFIPNRTPDIPGYEILGELGRGGMGVVYKARHLKLNRLVALKMILAGAHAAAAETARFLAEARAVAALQHPNIVQIFEIGEFDGRPYIALEYVAGSTLANRVKDRPLSSEEAAALVEQLAQAVQHAHERGIVHRDLKPANLLLSSEFKVQSSKFNTNFEPGTLNSELGVPKISDFGLARCFSGDAAAALTASGAALGTPDYMAPEQARGEAKHVGPPVDIWALGAILYRLITGRPPFAAATAFDTLTQVVSQPATPPSQVRSGLPTALDAICLKCLEKRPEHRYASAADLADDLLRFLGGEPVRARSSRPLSRRPVLLAVAAVLLVVLPIAYSLRPRRPDVVPVRSTDDASLRAELDLRVWKKTRENEDVLKGPGLTLKDAEALPLRPGDHMQIVGQANRPAYLYVIHIDSSGEASPMFPWRRYDWNNRPEEQPGESVSLPPDGGGAPLKASPSGIESVLLLARPEPLSAEQNAALARLFAEPVLRQEPELDLLRGAVWIAAAEPAKFGHDRDRGRPELAAAKRVDDPVDQVRRLLRGELRDLFTDVRAVCYTFDGR